MKTLLITGVSGGQGKVLARALVKRNAVCGVDPVRWPGAPRGVQVHDVDLRKRRFQDLISHVRPEVIVHLGFVRHFELGPERRRGLSAAGTERLLEHCTGYGVRQLIVVSSSYVYGARPENPFHLDEVASLSARREDGELRDLVEVDSIATSFLWRAPELATCVLRPVSVLGSTVRSMAARYLRLRRVPTVLGFDPMMQFVHEQDVAHAVELAIERELRGVFNVVGVGEVPIHTAVRACGGTPVPLPEPLFRSRLLRRLQGVERTGFPEGIEDYLKYPVTLSGERFTKATGFAPRHSLSDCFESIRSR